MLWLGVPVVLVLVVSAWLSYRSAARQATLVTDRQLIASARMIAERIDYTDGAISVVVPPSALEIFSSDSHDEVAYAVVGQHSQLVAGFPGLDPPPEVPPDFGHRAYETMFRTEAMRAMILRQPVIVPGGTVSVSVMVGETLKGRDALIRSLWVRGFVEETTLVLAGALSIWIGINRELRPILSLRRAVLDRPADRFEPFDSSSVQSEIRPLVEALNSHMQRLERQLRRQRRFLDSAAHQLRTPLAVMKTQIGYARRTREATDSALALEAIDGNLSAMSRLTSQLLTLGRVEHGRASLRAETVDLGLVVRAAVAEAAPRALDHGVELALDLAGHCPVTGTTMLVTEMANNLIDNAIRHAGVGAVATVSVRRSGATAMMVVEDDGAGASDDDRASLLERFRRGRNTQSGGSGLGLSIVAEIAEMFGGTVEIPARAGGRGFCVVVHLPLTEPDGRQSTSPSRRS